MGQYKGVTGGVSAIVTNGFTPWWYGIDGTIDPTLVEGRVLTVREAYETVLDWHVVEKDVYVNIGDDDNPILVKDEDFKATVRADQSKRLGIVGEGYGVVQNDALAEFGEALEKVKRGTVEVVSAGTLYDDKVAWMLFKLGEDRYFADLDERIARYGLASKGHDGSQALTFRETNVRTECMNTFDWAVKNDAALVTLPHRRNAADLVSDATRAVERAYDHADALDAEIEELLSQSVSRHQYKDIVVPTLVGDKPELRTDESTRRTTNWERRRDGLIGAYDRPDQANIAGTGWGAVMAVNSFELWDAQVRGDRFTSHARKALRGDFPLTAKAKQLVLAN